MLKIRNEFLQDVLNTISKIEHTSVITSKHTTREIKASICLVYGLELKSFSNTMSREFPTQYSAGLRKVLKAISIGTPHIMGSSAEHTMMYSADFDLLEVVPFKLRSVSMFQKKVYGIQKVGKIVDIKCGEITEWNLLKKPHIKKNVKNYNQKDELAHLNQLWQEKIISGKEYDMAKELLKPSLTIPEFLFARKELRFGLLRWTVQDVLNGYKQFRDKHIMLSEAMKSKGITKIDVVAWVKTKYVEFSNIIIWTKKGKPYAHIPVIKQALAEDIRMYEADGNYVKVAKRMLNLAIKLGNTTDVQKLTEVLNSPLGKLYMVTSDLEVLQEYPDAVAPKKREELDYMRDDFAKLFYPELVSATPKLSLLPKLKEVLQKNMKITLEEKHLLPIHRDYSL